MTCAKCKRELTIKTFWAIIGEPHEEIKGYCESCWKELMKDQPVNPAYTTPPHIPEKLT